MQSLNLRKTAQDQFLPVKLISSEEPFSAQAQRGASLGLCRTLQVLSPSSIDAATVSICKPLATEEGLILTILDIFPHKKQASRQRYMGKTSGSPALQQCLSEKQRSSHSSCFGEQRTREAWLSRHTSGRRPQSISHGLVPVWLPSSEMRLGSCDLAVIKGR